MINNIKIPVVILNGFLGSGKTTLFKNLLNQSKKKKINVSAIVNDMSELDVDGELLGNVSIIEENNIKGIIIGNPVNMDGSSGSSAQSVKDTSNNIEMSINLPICLWDERLSTVGAFNLSSQLDINVTKREKKIDENAAAFILQGAIDFLNN